MAKRLFWRFKPHDTGVFVRWDDRNRLVYLSDDADGREVSYMMQSECLEHILLYQYLPGMPIRVQFGEASKSTSQMNGGTRMERRAAYGGGYAMRRIDGYVGFQCVSAIAHAAPRIALLSLYAMIDEFGHEDAIKHLREFQQGASTLQTEISLKRSRRDYNASTINIYKGLLCMTRRLSDQVTVEGRRLNFNAQLPESVLMALPGRPLHTILDHLVTCDPNIIIERMHVNGDRMTAWTDTVVSIDEAIGLVNAHRQPLAKAA